MRGLLRRQTRGLAAGLLVAISVALSAQCVTTAEMSLAEQACCALMGHDCGPMAGEHECCKSEAPRIDQRSAEPRATLPVPHAPAIDLDLPPATSHLDSGASVPVFTGLVVKPPGVPTYLLISTLRL